MHKHVYKKRRSQMPTLRIDLHVHTLYSYDGFTPVEALASLAERHGLNGVAITDHDTVRGALKALKEITHVIIIPGEEITTKSGHLLALGVTEHISSGLEIAEAAEKIRDQGALVVLPHPGVLYKSAINKQIAKKINLDAIETINASAIPFGFSTRLSRKLAEEFALPQTAGSDSHIPETIGDAYSQIQTESTDLESILHAIKNGQSSQHGQGTSLNCRLKKAWLSIIKTK